MQNTTLKSKLVLSFSITFIVALLIGYALGTLISQYTITNTSAIKTIDVGVFSDQNCTQPITDINWGILEPNTSKTIMVYVKSSSNVHITLTVYTENWNPINCINYITLTANPNNILIEPSQVIQLSLTLNVASNIHGIKDFSFLIIFNGSG